MLTQLLTDISDASLFIRTYDSIYIDLDILSYLRRIYTKTIQDQMKD